MQQDDPGYPWGSAFACYCLGNKRIARPKPYDLAAWHEAFSEKKKTQEGA